MGSHIYTTPKNDQEAIAAARAALDQLSEGFCPRPIDSAAASGSGRELIEAVNRLRDKLSGIHAGGRESLIERDLRMAERALQESEEKFRVLAKTVHEAIISVNDQEKVVFWNRGAHRLFGYRPDEAVGKDINALSPGACIAGVCCTEHGSGRSAAQEGAGLIECVAARQDGSTFPAEVSVSRWTSHGSAYQTVIVRDITARKKVQAALAEEKSRLEATLGAVADGVISFDARGNALLLNHAAERMCGWSREESGGKRGKDILMLRDPETDAPCFDRVFKSAIGGETVEYDFLILESRQGARRDVALSGAPMHDTGGAITGVVLAFGDITDKRRLEDEIFRARKLDSLGVLAGGIAHDFNNILTGIITNLFMAKTALRPEAEPYAMIAEAEQAAFRASRLTKQLLTFSEGGEPVKESASMSELIQDSAGFCLSGSNVDSNLDIPDDLWAVEIDRGQIDQVLNNLILNAKQAMPEGGTVSIRACNMTVSDRVSEATEAHVPLAPGSYVKVSVADTGPGIEQEHLGRIFDPYFTTRDGQAGLGLATVYSIVQKHGGFITAKSAPGKGATFIFYLPAIPNRTESHPPQLESIGGKRRVLVMDDDEVIRSVVVRLLKRAGMDVTAVAEGGSAIDAYREALARGNRYDVVLMDLTVKGGMGGKEAMKRLLEVDPSARVIVASGYANDPIMANFREYGFVNVLRKPFNVNDFIRVIVEVIGEG
jgi:PAS domain S-box-containing protein